MKPKLFLLLWIFLSMNMISYSQSPPTSPGCNGFPTLQNSISINPIDKYQWVNIGGSRSSVNFEGGDLIVCGELTLNSGNFNSGRIFVEPDGVLVINNSISNINIINRGVIKFESNNMNINTGGIIWNFGDSIYFTGNGTHNINGSLITGGNSTTSFSQSIHLNGNGNIIVEDFGTLNISGSFSSDGTISLGSNSELNVGGAFSANSNTTITTTDNSVINIFGSSSFNSPTINYAGSMSGGAFIFLYGSTSMNNFSSFENIYVCTSQSLTPIQLGNAQLDCDAYNNIGPGLPLPIVLDFFKVKLINNYLEFSWRTLSEVNNSHFLIQQSNDLINWKLISQVEGSNTTTIPQSYYYISSYQDYSYYRLIQVDLNGDYEIFNTIFLSKEPKINIFDSHIEINNYNQFNYNLIIFDLSGRKIENINGNANQFRYDISLLESGIYNITLIIDGEVHHRKIFIVKN